MAIFGKKEEQPVRPASPNTSPAAPPVASGPLYGIGDFIRLMRSLPFDQNTDLTVRIIKSTLESVNVRMDNLVEDATKHQEKLSAQIGTMQGKILELNKQIDTFRQEVMRLEQELNETRTAKERLEAADKAADKPVAGTPIGAGNLPPPSIPRPKSLPPKPTEPR